MVLKKKRDYSKLARISVNFSNIGDFDWHLDIKKSTATPPIELRKELGRIAKKAISESAKRYNWRGQKSNSEFGSTTLEPLWIDEKTREGIKKYKINRNHPLIKTVISQEDKMITKVFKLLEDNIPIELILSNQNEDPLFHELEKQPEIPDDQLIYLAVELFNIYKAQQIPSDLARQKIMNSTPFNLFPLINEYLI